MNKKLAFMWLKVVFMLGSLATIFYVRSYLSSGNAFKDPNSPVQVLVGGTEVERSAKVIREEPPKPQKHGAPATQDP